MDYNAPDREILRQYLLGRLEGNVEMEDQISKAVLVDDDLSEMVESIEDEIIEEYLEGTLDSFDRKAASEYFLLPPERQQKLRFLRLLRGHFATRRHVVSEIQGNFSPVQVVDAPKPRAPWKWSQVWIYGQAVALFIVAVLGAQYVSRVHKSQAVLDADLARERAHSASLATAMEQLQEPVALLTLANERGRSLGEVFSSTEISRSTERVHVTIALISQLKAASYVAKLNAPQSSEAVWTAKLLPTEDKFGNVQLRFEVPAQGLQAGHYSFVVSPEGPAGTRYYYDFEVKLRE
jgi:hypothetical protein